MNQQTSFRDKVLDIVRLIPKGKTMTYAEVAELAGSSGAYRAVGSIMKSNFDPSIPCHRVIRSDGNLGESNRGKEWQSSAFVTHRRKFDSRRGLLFCSIVFICTYQKKSTT
jgi:methylated-DNA-[protein]-cysteine S-methyltransferase